MAFICLGVRLWPGSSRGVRRAPRPGWRPLPRTRSRNACEQMICCDSHHGTAETAAWKRSTQLGWKPQQRRSCLAQRPAHHVLFFSPSH